MLLLAVGIFLPVSSPGQDDVPGTPCGVDKPGACFAPTPLGGTGAIIDDDPELLAVFLEGPNDFFQLLPNGIIREHDSDRLARVDYCPTEVILAGMCFPGSPEVFRGEGRVSASVILAPDGALLCPSVAHIRGQVEDPHTGELFDVEGSLLSVGRGDIPEDCQLTEEVNAEPS